MNDECRCWFQYAEENRQVAELCFESGLFNSCLQNAQQAVEKALKALCLAVELPLKKTHSIGELIADLRNVGIKIEFIEDDVDLLDSVYLPSKYPLGSALPDFHPDNSLAQRCLALANRVFDDVRRRLNADHLL